MTALPETAHKATRIPDIPTTRETTGQSELPKLVWPMNDGVLSNPRTQILPSRSDEGPGLTILTPPDSAFSVRAPLTGRMMQVMQLDKRSTVILKPEDPSFLVILSNLQDVTIHPQVLRENEPEDPEYAVTVSAGDIIGSYGSTRHGLTMQIAHLSHDSTTGIPNWELLDPQRVLPQLR